MTFACVALLACLASSLVAASAQPRPLAVDPVIGHWETNNDAGETIVIADARKWETQPAAVPFPLALIRDVNDFRDGVLAVKFNLIAGESDQIAGLAFGVTPQAEYYYARYNTKDGNVALWRFEGGERRRLMDGTEHLQLPLNSWHELRVEVRGTKVIASVAGKLRIEHTLPAPVTGRVGFYTKRDSVTAFKSFRIEDALQIASDIDVNVKDPS